MKKFTVTFVRKFEVDIEALDTESAGKLASQIIGQFPEGTCRLLSVIEEGAKVEVLAEISEGGRTTPPRGGKPNGGGSPGTPVVRQQEVLVDQIAEAA